MFDDSARLRLLHELGLAFAARTDLDELCRLVTDTCAGVMRAEGVSILLLDPQTNELYFPYVANADAAAAARLREMRFPADQGIAGYTLSTGQGVRIVDAASDARFYRGVDEQSGTTTRSLLAAPLRSESGVLGVLQVVNRLGGGSFGDDDLSFLESLAGTVAVAVENARLLAATRAQLAALQRATEERAALEALRRELDIARDIQQSILPANFPRRPEFELFATMLPARDVGGDFYDFFFVDEGRLGLVIGDVSGKGVGAALFMAVSRTLVKATALGGASPAACLDRVNRLLLAENTSDMFVTLFYALIDVRSGRMLFSNGGHNPPLLRRLGGGIEALPRTGPLLGVLDGGGFTDGTLALGNGDLLLLYTDGVTEAADPRASLYGEPALRDFLRDSRASTPAELVRDLVAGVQAHSAGVAQTDDIAVLALRFSGGGR